MDSEAHKRWVAENADRVREYKRKSAAKYRERDREKHRLRAKDTYWRDPEKHKERQRARTKENPEARKAVRLRQRERWAKANPEKVEAALKRKAEHARTTAAEKGRARSRAYYYRNQERWQAWAKEYRKKNPEFAQIHTRKRRAWKSVRGSHTPQDIIDILKAQLRRCAYCKKKLRGDRQNYHVDHIAPLSNGGSNDRSNLQILCPPCNRRKSSKAPEKFARELGLLL